MHLPRMCLRLDDAASARDSEWRDVGEGGGVSERPRALQDSQGAHGVHASVHAPAGHHGAHGESFRRRCSCSRRRPTSQAGGDDALTVSNCRKLVSRDQLPYH